MADITISGRSRDKAVLLLAAAEDLGLEASVVRTTTSAYIVPEEVATQAGLGEEGGEDKPRRAAKKVAAKKAATPKPDGEE